MWCLDTRIDRVFEAIDDAARWPQWWKGVTRADMLEPGDENCIGRLWRFTWRSQLPYDLTCEGRVTRREPPYPLEGEADVDYKEIITAPRTDHVGQRRPATLSDKIARCERQRSRLPRLTEAGVRAPIPGALASRPGRASHA